MSQSRINTKKETPIEDERIGELNEAVRNMAKGKFHVSLPTNPDDEVGQLGMELSRLSKTLERRFQEISTLQQLTEKINAGLLLDDILDSVYESFFTVLPYDRIGFSLLSDDGSILKARWARSSYRGVQLGKGFSAPMAGSSLEQVMLTGKPRILNDLEEYLKNKPSSRSTRKIVREGIRSSLTCPLVAMGKPIGFMFFASRTPHTYENQHVELFLQLAGQLSMIVEKARLYQELAETKQQLEVANAKLEKIAYLDGLTQISNRRVFDETIYKEWLRSMRAEEPLGLLLIDIDFFKKYNDYYGHLAGDECLQEVAKALQDTLKRAGDFVARYGGEEFAVIIPHTNLPGAETVASLLNDAIENLELPHVRSKITDHVTVSIGVACRVPQRGEQPDVLIQSADEALYQAKENGRNQYVTWQDPDKLEPSADC